MTPRPWGAARAGLVLLSTLALAQPEPRFALREGCSLPYNAVPPAIDAFLWCDNAGRMAKRAFPSLQDRLRNDAKNNLCGHRDETIHLDLRQLLDLPEVPAALTGSRSALRELTRVEEGWLGEGSVVSVVALPRHAAVSNCEYSPALRQPGNPVNCHVLGLRASDITLALRAPAGSGRPVRAGCTEAAAVLIPHSRPVAWSAIDLKTPVAPVRISGQLFYNDQAPGCGPSGRARWEIHPVYSIEVCMAKNAAECVDRAPVWRAYDQWVQLPDAVTKATGAKERRLCAAAANEPGI